VAYDNLPTVDIYPVIGRAIFSGNDEVGGGQAKNLGNRIGTLGSICAQKGLIPEGLPPYIFW